MNNIGEEGTQLWDVILYPTPQGCGYNNKGCLRSLKNSSLDPDDSDNYSHRGSVTVAVTRGKVG